MQKKIWLINEKYLSSLMLIIGSLLFFIRVYAAPSMNDSFGHPLNIIKTPPWMIFTESTYNCSNPNKSTKCLATLHGVGVILIIPADTLYASGPHYLVITDAHLTHGNVTTQPLKLSYSVNGKLQPLSILKRGDSIIRLSDNYRDIDIIEVEKPKDLPDEVMFRYFKMEESKSSKLDGKIKNNNNISLLIAKDLNHDYLEFKASEDLFIVPPPPILVKNPKAYEADPLLQANEVFFNLGNAVDETVQGVGFTKFGEEIVSHSQIVGGMSGSPLLRRKNGYIGILGLSKSYHRFFPKSYLSTKEQIINLIEDFMTFYYGKNKRSLDNLKTQNLFLEPLNFLKTFVKSIIPKSVQWQWNYNKRIGTYIEDTSNGLSEIRANEIPSGQITFNEPDSEKKNAGGGETADGGGGETADGGGETADGERIKSGGETADGGRSQSEEAIKIDQLNKGMNYFGQNVLGLLVKIPAHSLDGQNTEVKEFVVDGSFNSIEWIQAFSDLIHKEFKKEIIYEAMNKNINIYELFNRKLLGSIKYNDINHPPTLKELNLNPLLKQKYDSVIRTEAQDNADNLPSCLISQDSIKKLTQLSANKDYLEIAILRPSKVKQLVHPINEYGDLYEVIKINFSDQWQAATSTNAIDVISKTSKTSKGVSPKESQLVLNTKGLFMLNLIDIDCSSLTCPMIFRLAATPYLHFKWKEEINSQVGQCMILDNKDFFISRRLGSFKMSPF